MMKHADPNSLLVTLPADQMQRLNELVESGEYASRDEVILDALRLWEERNAVEMLDDEFLEAEYEAGLASGEPVAVDIDDLIISFKAAKHAGG